MQSVALICLFIGGAAFVHAEPARLQYDVTLLADKPNSAQVSLQLDSGRGLIGSRELLTRLHSSEAQVSNVACDGVPLKTSNRQTWLAAPNCGRLTWSIDFRVLSTTDYRPDLQANAYFPSSKWWLVSEATGFVRPVGDEGPASVQFHIVGGSPGWSVVGGAQLDLPNTWALAPTNRAPEFFAIGLFVRRQVVLQGIKLDYVIDSLGDFDALGLTKYHSAAIRYLQEVVGQRMDTGQPAHLGIIWLGVPEAKGTISGAAGARTYIANYIIGEADHLETNVAHSMVVVAHEQFHQLVDAVRADRDALPVWVGESLAEYYGLKALRKIGLSTTVAADASDKILGRHLPFDVGLLEASRRYASGDKAASEYFYTQGANFWFEIDEAIVKSTQGKKSLDSFIPELLVSDFLKSEELPAGFLVSLRQVLPDDWDRLSAKYIGK